MSNVLPRAESVTVPNLFAEPSQADPVTIPLDPRRTVAQNAERFYQLASRARRGLAQVAPRLAATQAELRRIEMALDQIEQADEATLALLADQLEGMTHTPPERADPKTRRTPPRQPYREFLTEAGLRVRVGRSARDNDQLTFSLSRGRDVWLHARDVPGSHVVLRLDRRGEPDFQSLLDAALLAKHYSDARQVTGCDVSWTRVKHVRRGPRPGQVYLSQEKTLWVRDDPARWQRLVGCHTDFARMITLLDSLYQP